MVMTDREWRREIIFSRSELTGRGTGKWWSSAMNTRTDAWESWFQANASSTERFLYLIDESSDFAQIEQWAGWVKNNPGVGKNLKTFATTSMPTALTSMPSLSIPATWFTVGATTTWQNAANTIAADPSKAFYAYNGKRPSNGSFATEDDGVALRELAWAQYKKNVKRWFFWEGAYYNDYQGGRGETNVFQTACTFGGPATPNSIRGESGWNYSNGTACCSILEQYRLSAESYNLQVRSASLRLKHWNMVFRTSITSPWQRLKIRVPPRLS